MNTGEARDFRHDYATLGAPIGCQPDELKRCYRQAMQRLHPDRNPELAEDAAAQHELREKSQAYRRLMDYARAHGKLPGMRPARPQQASDDAAEAPPPRRGRARRAFAAAALAGLAWYGWQFHAPEPAQAIVVQASPPPRASARPFATTAEPGLANRRGIRLGDSKLAVRAILGPPILGDKDVWEYGPSHVRFDRGQVIGWYNSPMKPLRVEELSSAPGEAGRPDSRDPPGT